ncbi:hypothetical protein PF008_g7736 [Phytophthora fragariae]|uniref:Uncharacterized protein n=1 Tax=Phytophthora fragariae TaxID=53985 RepID=A0A6G0S282_9STRA|nr:hypothetical protein PF008_g7736 [Phytophthora fragariae]
MLWNCRSNLSVASAIVFSGLWKVAALKETGTLFFLTMIISCRNFAFASTSSSLVIRGALVMYGSSNEIQRRSGSMSLSKRVSTSSKKLWRTDCIVNRTGTANCSFFTLA